MNKLEYSELLPDEDNESNSDYCGVKEHTRVHIVGELVAAVTSNVIPIDPNFELVYIMRSEDWEMIYWTDVGFLRGDVIADKSTLPAGVTRLEAIDIISDAMRILNL